MGACTKVFALAHVMHFVVFLVGSAPSVEVASTNDRITCARKCTCSLWVKHDFALYVRQEKDVMRCRRQISAHGIILQLVILTAEEPDLLLIEDAGMEMSGPC